MYISGIQLEPEDDPVVSHERRPSHFFFPACVCGVQLYLCVFAWGGGHVCVSGCALVPMEAQS